MSDDDVNQLTPDDGDLDEVVVARLRSALLNDVVINDTERDHTIASVLEAPTTNLRRQLSTLSRNADSDHRGFSSLQPPSSLSPSAQERYCSFAAVRVIRHNFPSKKVLENDQKKICNLNLKNLRLLKSQRWRNLRSKRRPKLSHWATWR